MPRGEIVNIDFRPFIVALLKKFNSKEGHGNHD